MQRHQTRAGLILVAVVTSLGLAGAAQAQEGKAARLLKQANERCFGKKPEAALPIFEEAIKAKPSAEIHLAYGECLRQLGKCDKALEQYQLALKLAKGRKNREQAAGLIKLCRDELEAKAAAQPAAPPKSPAAEQHAAGEQPPDLSASRPAPPPPPPSAKRRRLSPIYFWTGVGVTAALLATGIGTGAVALQKSSKYKDPSTPAGELQGLKDTGEALKLTSTLTFVIGGATAVATTVLFFYTRFKPAEAVSAAPVPGGAVVVIGGKF